MNAILMLGIIDWRLFTTNAMHVPLVSTDMNQLERAIGVTQVAKNVGLVLNMNVLNAIILNII
jgi:hypothetical protein